MNLTFSCGLVLCKKHYEVLKESLSREGAPAKITKEDWRSFKSYSGCFLPECSTVWDVCISLRIEIPMEGDP